MRASLAQFAAPRLAHAPDRIQLRRAAVAAAITALVAYLGVHKFGAVGIVAPLALAVAIAVLSRPLVAMCLLFGLTVLCEGPSFGFLGFTSHLYDQVYKHLTPLDMLVALAAFASAFDIIGNRRTLHIPGPLKPAAVTLLLAIIAGSVTGYGNGESVRSVILDQNVLLYLLLLPTAVANLTVSRRRLTLLLAAVMVLAILKAVFGLIEVKEGYGSPIEGATTLTYYEPTANWVMMIGILTVCAALVTKVRIPRWMLLGTPLLVASLVLSYRRSFWIGAVLAIGLVILIGVAPSGRKVLLPAALLVAVAAFLMGSVNVQSQSPLVRRITSLNPTSLEQNVETNYRNNERANVLHEIEEHPLTGLGVGIPWSSATEPLDVEHEEGRYYVHFAALWFWLKLGVLGLVAYISFIAGTAVLAWRVWRRRSEPLLRALGLASLAGLAGLVVIEATATFTGVDPRFTVVIAVQAGLLALLARHRGEEPMMDDEARATARTPQLSLRKAWRRTAQPALPKG